MMQQVDKHKNQKEGKEPSEPNLFGRLPALKRVAEVGKRMGYLGVENPQKTKMDTQGNGRKNKPPAEDKPFVNHFRRDENFFMMTPPLEDSTFE